MTASADSREPLECLAEEFAQRCRRGERPALTEYTARYPELADEIRELFPALVLMEQFGSVAAPPTGPDGASRPDAARVPGQLGDYRILREIGRGGMGLVYEAVQESLGRHVALKVLPPQNRTQPTHLERFRRAARAAARLHHTNIVPVFSVGEHAGLYYYALQFIHGQGLDAILEEVKRLRARKQGADEGAPAPTVLLAAGLAEGLWSGRFVGEEGAAEPPPATPRPETSTDAPAGTEGSASGLTTASDTQYYRAVARIGLQTAEALAYAHGQGILHRDVKPSNLLLDTHGTVWVTDFGLAKAEGSDELTHTGDIVGTLRYIAPERFEGQADARSDVYSLGLTLYEMLTLRPAFDAGDRARLIQRVLHDELPRLRHLDGRIPRDLETVVLKAAARSPGDRYVGAGALAEDLRRFLADRPILARRNSARERLWRWCRRNPVVARLVGAVAFLLVTITAVSVGSGFWLAAERNAARRAEREKTEQLAESYLNEARAWRWSGRAGQRLKGLEALGKAADIVRSLNPEPAKLLQLRNEAIACLALVDVRLAKEWPVPPGDVWFSFDEKLEHYAYLVEAGTVVVRRVAEPEDGFSLPCPGWSWCGGRFSPGGKLFAGRDGGQPGALRVWDLDSRRVLLELPAGLCGLEFTADGRGLAVCQDDNAVHFFDLPSGKQARRLPLGPSAGIGCRFHPDGRQFAVPVNNTVRICDVETGELLRTLFAPAPLADLAWRPDGKRLAAGAEDMRVYVWDVEDGRQIASLEGHAAEVQQVAYNHAGTLLASVGWDGILILWDAGSGRRVLRYPGMSFHQLQFSPDDRFLAYTLADSRMGLLEVVGGRELRTLFGHEKAGKGPWRVSLSPDGLLAASAGNDGVRLWATAPGSELAFLSSGPSQSAVFHPDGRSLFTHGNTRVLRWPLNAEPEAAPGTLRLGPPEQLLDMPPGIGGRWLSLSADGNTLAATDNARGQALVLDLRSRAAPRVLGGHPSIARVEISPDGQSAVSTGWPQERTLVWDVQSGAVVKDLGAGRLNPAFSPSGRHLVLSGGRFSLWKTGSWELRKEFPGTDGGSPIASAAFDAAERVLALHAGHAGVKLLDATTHEATPARNEAAEHPLPAAKPNRFRIRKLEARVAPAILVPALSTARATATRITTSGGQ
jgi:serine/threonine protein kinase/WD40 repeat protein